MVWRSGYRKLDIDQALPHDSFQILFVFDLFINGWFIQFQTLFWATECDSGAKQHFPTLSIPARWGQNVVDCSYFFNFEGCVVAKQIHWKMLVVINNMAFFSCIYKCSMFVKLYVTVMYQCVYGNLIPIMLRLVYLAKAPYEILYVYWYGSPTGDTYTIILFPMF